MNAENNVVKLRLLPLAKCPTTYPEPRDGITVIQTLYGTWLLTSHRGGRSVQMRLSTAEVREVGRLCIAAVYDQEKR